jgi:hypothetical protein
MAEDAAALGLIPKARLPEILRERAEEASLPA